MRGLIKIKHLAEDNQVELKELFKFLLNKQEKPRFFVKMPELHTWLPQKADLEKIRKGKKITIKEEQHFVLTDDFEYGVNDLCVSDRFSLSKEDLKNLQPIKSPESNQGKHWGKKHEVIAEAAVQIIEENRTSSGNDGRFYIWQKNKKTPTLNGRAIADAIEYQRKRWPELLDKKDTQGCKYSNILKITRKLIKDPKFLASEYSLEN